jgi:hypothetical protein
MSKDLDANNLADALTGFQNDWPLSNNDAKLTKKQQDNLKALTTSLLKWMKMWPNGTNFWTEFGASNKAKVPLLYPEKSLN